MIHSNEHILQHSSRDIDIISSMYVYLCVFFCPKQYYCTYTYTYMYIFRLPAQQIIVHSHYKRFMSQVLPFKEAQDRIIAWKQYGVYTHNSILLLLYNTYLIIRISFFSMVMPLFILQLDTITSIFCLIYLPIETQQAELPIGCV